MTDLGGNTFGVCHEDSLMSKTTETSPFFLEDLDYIHYCKRISSFNKLSLVGKEITPVPQKLERLVGAGLRVPDQVPGDLGVVPVRFR